VRYVVGRVLVYLAAINITRSDKSIGEGVQTNDKAVFVP
jgi:hypothetical protein